MRTRLLLIIEWQIPDHQSIINHYAVTDLLLIDAVTDLLITKAIADLLIVKAVAERRRRG